MIKKSSIRIEPEKFCLPEINEMFSDIKQSLMIKTGGPRGHILTL